MKNCLLIFCLSVLASFSLPNLSHAQYQIKGKVIDEQGQSLMGASILIDRTTQGAVTNIDGTFTLMIPDSCARINITYTGFEPIMQEKVCYQQKAFRFQLKASEVVMDEVVVTGYSVQKKRAVANFRSNRMNGGALMAAPSYTPAGYSDAGVVHNTEDYDLIQENTFLAVKDEPLSTFSIDVDAASYSNLRRFVNNGSLPPRDAVRIEEMINYFNYDYEAPRAEHPFSVTTELSDCPWNADHQLLHIGLQGKEIPTDDLPASNLVFLLDVSGSMNAANKLPLLKSSFKLLTDQMRPQDKVAIVVYAGSSGVVLDATSGDKKQDIMSALQRLEAGGSTAGGAGIKKAYQIARKHFVKGGNNRVILATDGDFNVGQSSDAELVRMIEEERESGVFLTVLGFGMGNYKDNKMQKLAKHGNGNHAYIDNIEEARKVLVTEFGGTMFTIAKDVKLQLEFNPAYVQGYRLIGYENRLLNNEDFNDDKKDAGELGAGHTVTALYEIIPAGSKSEVLKSVDALKYQEQTTNSAWKNGELMTVKLRYKQPDGNKSTKLEHVQAAKPIALDKSSDNFRWSAAVAGFGMLLRDSEFKGTTTFDEVLALARSAKGKDQEGYRIEFLKMVRSARDMKMPLTAEKK
ncbi:MAG TPA: von Willebrand factor type A domain-containing protein [Saprospiraceae bacterium]|nr:von Willebrand factor type A domain-containing protein [Saprospiraceae bacterium]